MKLIRRILLLLFIVLIILAAALGIFVGLWQERIVSAFIGKLNQTIDTRITYGSVKVSTFESFPSISVRFNNLLISPSKEYNKLLFPGEDRDTLLFAETFSLSADIPSLLSGTIAVRSISARDGEMNLFTDIDGNTNFKIISSEKKSLNKNIRLNNISIRNINTVWLDRKHDLSLRGKIEESNLSGEIFSSGIYLSASLKAYLNNGEIYRNYFRDIPAEASVRIRKTDNSFSFTRGALQMAGLNFGIDGNVNFNMKSLNVEITGKKIDVSDMLGFIPEKWSRFAGSFSPEGIMNINCLLSGAYGSAGSPHFDIRYDLSDGRFNYRLPGLKLNNLTFSGSVTNGKSNSPSTFDFVVDTLQASLGDASFAGSFRLRNLSSPFVNLSLSGDIIFEDLKNIFNSGAMNRHQGNIEGRIILSGKLPEDHRLTPNIIFSLRPDIYLLFKDFGTSISTGNIPLSGISGTVSIKENLRTENLTLTVFDQHFIINTEMRNFTGWLSGKPVVMEITGDVSANRFIPAFFTGAAKDSSVQEKKQFSLFPEDLRMNIRFRADSVISRDFIATHLSSTLSYSPYIFTFSNISAEGLDGTFTGEMLLGKQKDGSYISRVKLEVEEIDINKTFTSFNNFRQKFIVSDNLRGDLSGNVTVLTPLDQRFNIVTPALVAEAHLSIINGKLIDFGPAEKLSSFIDIDELKEISFSKLENDLYIKNSNVSVPKMLINSSAGNFTVFGNHSFNTDYSYHVRVLLSEVLSRKARERHRNDSRFGEVSVDNAGQATIPLKIVCENGETSVDYDFGQARDKIKENIAGEKQTLKSILNEEYGWYKGDTLVKKEEENKPRFTFTWEEGKEQPQQTEAEEEEVKESPLKNLFKKK